MRVVVDYQEEQLEFEVADDRVVAAFRGPSGIPQTERAAAILDALKQPRDFPPVSAMFVPGDSVAIALDSRFPNAADALAALMPIVRDAVGEAGEITIVATPDGGSALSDAAPDGIPLVIHDPSDRNKLAYLATTKAGRRIYLNRHLTDADVVVSIGELRFDPLLGRRGPWTVLFPDLSDLETIRESSAPLPPNSSADPSARLDESFEVSWLLGSQFSLGLVPARSGFAAVVAGLNASVRDQGMTLLERDWEFRAETRAELVVAGIGRPGEQPGMDELVAGITAAAGLVRQGGKIAILSHARGAVGPALRRLIDAGEPRLGAKALRSHQTDEDYSIAVRLNRALAWADVYLLSAFDPQLVEDLSMIPLTRAGEAARLAAGSHSCTFLSQAELARVSVADDT